MEQEIAALAARVSSWLERRHLLVRTVTLKVRYSGFSTITRSDTHLPAVASASVLTARAVTLLDRTEVSTRPVRLLGVSRTVRSKTRGQANKPACSSHRPCERASHVSVVGLPPYARMAAIRDFCQRPTSLIRVPFVLEP